MTVREGDLRRDDSGPGLRPGAGLRHLPHAGRGRNLDLLRRCARALAPGGRVAIREFILDPDRAGPPAAALFALNMLVGTAAGQHLHRGGVPVLAGAAGCSGHHPARPAGDWIIGWK